MTELQKHVHKFKRHVYRNKTRVFFCTLNCTFKIEVPLALGKESICNRCGKVFVMNERSLRLVNPHCDACAKIRVVDESTGEVKLVDKKELAPPPVIAEAADKQILDLEHELNSMVTVKEEPDEDL